MGKKRIKFYKICNNFLVMLLCETIENSGILWYNISVT